jgi:uncharacterized delta-60 repeat protein
VRADERDPTSGTANKVRAGDGWIVAFASKPTPWPPSLEGSLVPSSLSRLLRVRRFVVLLAGLASVTATAAPTVAATPPEAPTVYLAQNVTTTDFNGRDDMIGGLAVQRDGKVVAAGSATGPDGRQDLTLVRYLPTGTLDPTFGDDGKVITRIGWAAHANAVVIQPDDKIVVAGYAIAPDVSGENGLRFMLVRYLPDGRLDADFHHPEPWTALTDGGLPGVISALALQPDGKLVVGGNIGGDVRGGTFTVARYLPDGRLDKTFHSSGWDSMTFGQSGRSAARAVVVQPDGMIVAVGTADDYVAPLAMGRWLADGARDPGFAAPTSTAITSANAVQLQADGALVVGGSTLCGADACFGLARYRPDGSLDTSFGDGGVAATHIGIQAFLRALLVQPDGKILGVGTGSPHGNFDLDFAVARYEADGAPDRTFGIDGVATTHISPQVDDAFAAVVSGHNLIVGGRSSYGGPYASAKGSDFGLAGTVLPSVPAPPAGPGTALPIVTEPGARSGYWALASDGHVHSFGDAAALGHAAAGAVDIEPTPTGNGYWILDDPGQVQAFGDARPLGGITTRGLTKNERPASISALPSGRGYWIFTTRGRVFSFGEAEFLGDMSQTTILGPVLDSVATPSGRGYYMVASDGGIFAFGDAAFAGSMGGRTLNAAVQSLVPDSDGAGYWLVASDGGIFAFDAPFRGSMGGAKLNRPVSGMVRYGDGYLMVGEDGGIFNFSSLPFAGSLGDKPPASPVVAVAALPSERR